MTTTALLRSRRSRPGALSSDSQRRSIGAVWFLSYSLVILIGAVLVLIAAGRPDQPFLGISLASLGLLVFLWAWRPIVGLVAMVGLATISDIVTVSWFPFIKNLSSRESIMFIADSISITPFEITLIWALAITAYRNLATTGRPFVSAPLLRPLMVFGGFVVFGLVHGLSQGGNTRAAMFEVRPLLYLPVLYLLVVNVCRVRRHYNYVYAGALVGVFIQSLLSLHFLSTLDQTTRDGLESLNEHGSALGMNLLFVFVLIAMLYARVPPWLRIVLVVGAIPVVWVYFVAERRVAVIALVVAMGLLAILLFWRQRTTFLKVVPIVAVIGIAYLGAFWNSESSAGFPAQAVKSAVAPEDLGAADQSSNLYREIEKYNLHATIRSAPVTGIGFGQPFLRPIALADISVFEFYEYIPHNSLLWIWIKTGFGGFVTLLYVFARALGSGAERARALRAGSEAVVAAAGVLFVAMFAVFLYVEIAWEPRNVLLFAVALALCTTDFDGDGSELQSAGRTSSTIAASRAA